MQSEKERLISTLSHKERDRTAVISPGGMMSMAITEVMNMTGYYWPEAHQDSRKMADLAKGVHDLAGLENVGVPFCMTAEAEAFGCRVDYGERDTPPRVARHFIDETKNFRELEMLDPKRDCRLPVILEAIGLLHQEMTDVPVIGNLVGPVSLAGMVVEPLMFFRLMKETGKTVHGLLDFIADSLIEFGKAQAEYGADVIAISDPTASGEVLGPDLFEEFAAPYLNKVAGALRRTGVSTIVHICGNVGNVVRQLDQLETDCISVDAMVSIGKVKEQYPNMTLMGNVSTFLLEKGLRERIGQAAKLAVNSGVDILAPACGLSPKTPIENIRALTQSVCNH